MRNKKFFVAISAIAVCFMCLSFFFANGAVPILGSSTEPYGLAFSSSQNKFFAGTGTADQSGQATVQTYYGNDIDFQYHTVAGGSASVWHLVKDGGYFYNLDPIHGLKTIKISCTAADKQYRISWGRDLSFDLHSQDYMSSTSEVICDFYDECPTFFKFENVSGSNISIKNMVIELDCLNHHPELTLTSENEGQGTVYGGGIKLGGETVRISAWPNAGYLFVGWFDDEGVLVSSKREFTFTMPYMDLAYTAKFDWNPHSVSIEVNDENLGSVSGGGSYLYQQQVTLKASPNEHCSFFGWYDGDWLLSRELTYTFTMPDYALNYKARFVQNYQLTVYSENESMGTVSAPMEWGAGLEVTVTAESIGEYGLNYWCDENYDELSYDTEYTFTMPEHDVELIAVFAKGEYLALDSNFDGDLISVKGEGYFVPNHKVTVSATAVSDLAFVGWYDEDYNLLSYSNPGEFVFSKATTVVAYYRYPSALFYFGNKDPELKTCSITRVEGTLNGNVRTPKLGEGYRVTSIGGFAFSADCGVSCHSAAITISNGITSIGGYAFFECKMASIAIPDSVTSIGNCAFEGSWLTSITIPDNVRSIGDYAFAGSRLTSITIPASVTSFGSNALQHCRSLASATILGGITGLGITSFQGCISLSSLVIPNSLTSMDINVFCDTLLSSIVFLGTVAEWKAISKPEWWSAGSLVKVVHCSDGDVNI